MLQFAICDDEPAELAQADAHLQRYLTARGLTAQCRQFTHPDALLSTSETIAFDVYLLDIMMPMVTGIAVGQELRQRRISAQFIYLTSSTEFAVQAFALQAAHYLLKPYTAAAFDEAMDRALQIRQISNPPELLLQSNMSSVQALPVHEIEYIESCGHLQRLHLGGTAIRELRCPLARLQSDLEALVPGQFVLCSRGMLVNLRAVTQIASTTLRLRSGISLMIARGKAPEIKRAYFDCLFAKKGDAL
jgi:DNA-binding LytR/AlgR family response regulator